MQQCCSDWQSNGECRVAILVKKGENSTVLRWRKQKYCNLFWQYRLKRLQRQECSVLDPQAPPTPPAWPHLSWSKQTLWPECLAELHPNNALDVCSILNHLLFHEFNLWGHWGKHKKTLIQKTALGLGLYLLWYRTMQVTKLELFILQTMQSKIKFPETAFFYITTSI